MAILILAVPAWAGHAKKGPLKVFILAGDAVGEAMKKLLKNERRKERNTDGH